MPATSENTQDLLRVTEVASMLDVDRTTVLRWIDKGYLDSMKYPSGSHRIARAEVERFVRDSSKKKEEYRAMVIDDDWHFLATMKAILNESGLRLDVSTYLDGLEALLAIGREKPDVIIIDYLLSTVDGATLAARIRENPQYSTIPLILVSGLAELSPEDTRSSDAFLQKPFSPDRLETVLKEVLRVQ